MKIAYKYLNDSKINMYIENTYVGNVTILDTEEKAIYISKLFILKEYRNKGYGTQILKDIFISYGNKEGVSLHVDCENHKAFNLYKRLGFFIALIAPAEGKIKKHYLMAKNLSV